jgi:hypothetical protein
MEMRRGKDAHQRHAGDEQYFIWDGDDNYSATEEGDMKIDTSELNWAYIQKSTGPIAEQVDCFTFLEAANAGFNRLVERYAEYPHIVAPFGNKATRIDLLNQLGRTSYPIVALAHGESKTSPRTLHAAQQICTNFIGNIQLACNRIRADWADIAALFFAPDGVTITDLARIRATGSDSHKGGKQVLILTFAAKPHPVQLVYKPGDIEVDARILGRTHNIGRDGVHITDLKLSLIDPSLCKPSFSERISDWLGISEAVPVYRFLPRLTGSSLGNGDDLPIRNSYGYIEYLSHLPDSNDEGAIKGDYDRAHADWVFGDTDSPDRFYRESGRLMALATVLGLTDLHAANLIVHQRRPYLIDLEFTCATEKIGLELTGLLVPGQAQNAGIGGIEEFDLDINGPHSVVSRSYISLKKDGTPHKLDGSDACAGAMSSGFAETMDCLGAHMDEVISFVKDELGNCIARFNVFTTQELNNAFRAAYGREVTRQMPDWKQHKDHDPNLEICGYPGSLENSVKWFASTPQCFQRDIAVLDMPAFYRRLSTRWLLDSEGRRVERNSKKWEFNAPGVAWVVGNLQRIKPGWHVVGSRTKDLDALVASCVW